MVTKIKMIIINDVSVFSRGFQGRGPKGHCRKLWRIIASYKHPSRYARDNSNDGNNIPKICDQKINRLNCSNRIKSIQIKVIHVKLP